MALSEALELPTTPLPAPVLYGPALEPDERRLPVRRGFEALRDRIAAREARVAVIGLGYVGLPLALAYVSGVFPTTGLDVDEGRVATLRAGRSPVGDVPNAEL